MSGAGSRQNESGWWESSTKTDEYSGRGDASSKSEEEAFSQNNRKYNEDYHYEGYSDKKNKFDSELDDVISKKSIRDSLKEAGILNRNGKMVNRVKISILDSK